MWKVCIVYVYQRSTITESYYNSFKSEIKLTKYYRETAVIERCGIHLNSIIFELFIHLHPRIEQLQLRCNMEINYVHLIEFHKDIALGKIYATENPSLFNLIPRH